MFPPALRALVVGMAAPTWGCSAPYGRVGDGDGDVDSAGLVTFVAAGRPPAGR